MAAILPAILPVAPCPAAKQYFSDGASRPGMMNQKADSASEIVTREQYETALREAKAAAILEERQRILDLLEMDIPAAEHLIAAAIVEGKTRGEVSGEILAGAMHEQLPGGSLIWACSKKSA
ncbi:MAG: hypothetical protein U5P41_14430 [Gammaproteobacteria bacterium]|nr:hypothetical protein [Gammaproteobacteria bacterium]